MTITLTGPLRRFVNHGSISGTYALTVDGSVGVLTNTRAGKTGGRINGVSAGVFVDGAAAGTLFKLVNNGIITASGLDAVSNTGTIVNILNNATGTIHGARFGIVNFNTMNNITNFGTISGDYQGVAATGSGVRTLSNSGVISGGHGLGTDNIAVNGTFKLLTNTASGAIAGSGTGIWFRGGDIENAGAVSGGTYGVFVDSGSNATIANTGTITGNDAIVNWYGATATITNAASGLIDGVRFGISNLGEPIDISNSGSIHGDFVGVAAGGESNTLTNSGEISAGQGLGINQAAVNGNFALLTNTTSGAIVGSGTGIWIKGGEIDNAGSVSGGTYGVFVETGANATIDNAGTITGNDAIVNWYGGTATITNAASGLIDGVRFGISNLGNPLDISNAGSIHGDFVGVAPGGSTNTPAASMATLSA
ncbi:MAG: hypothetical protein NT133_11755 [Alphaproteobacteria bacterium]|nr:hypothetical protein [Alphaproteobacteria bacterium]